MGLKTNNHIKIINKNIPSLPDFIDTSIFHYNDYDVWKDEDLKSIAFVFSCYILNNYKRFQKFLEELENIKKGK